MAPNPALLHPCPAWLLSLGPPTSPPGWLPSLGPPASPPAHPPSPTPNMPPPTPAAGAGWAVEGAVRVPTGLAAPAVKPLGNRGSPCEPETPRCNGGPPPNGSVDALPPPPNTNDGAEGKAAPWDGAAELEVPERGAGAGAALLPAALSAAVGSGLESKGGWGLQAIGEPPAWLQAEALVSAPLAGAPTTGVWLGRGPEGPWGAAGVAKAGAGAPTGEAEGEAPRLLLGCLWRRRLRGLLALRGVAPPAWVCMAVAVLVRSVVSDHEPVRRVRQGIRGR